MDRKFSIDIFELSFLTEACIPDKDVDNFTNIEWRPVIGFEGCYVVSEFGHVISLNRYIIRKNGIKQFIHSKLLKPTIDKKGYLLLRLSIEGKMTSLKVHQIVAMTFLSHTPNGNTIVVDHIDNNKLNNHFSNLQLMTPAENTRKNTLKNSLEKTSSFRGVGWSKEKKKWRSSIKHNGKNFHLGYFNCEKTASEYYENALINVNNNDIESIKIKKRKKSSKYKGVTFSKSSNKWRGAFRFKGSFYSAGSFETEEEAYKNYLDLYNKITNKNE